MKGTELMREAALLGARCLLGEPQDRVPAAEDGWDTHPQERAILLERMRAHEASDDPNLVRLRDELGLGTDSYWLVMLCAAAELYPEAAAAVSLLNEDSRLQLPTPMAVARLFRGIRGTSYQKALFVALNGGVARTMGLVEVLEQTPGLPHSQHALRLVLSELGSVHDDLAALGSSLELPSVLAPAAVQTAFDTEVVHRAARLLRRRQLLVLQGPSRRGSRQMASDIATSLGARAHIVTVVHQLPPAAELSRMRNGLLVLDLHSLDTVPHVVLSRLAGSLGQLVVVADERADTGDAAVFDVGTIGYPEALRVWAQLVGREDALALAAQFRVTGEEAHGAVREAADLEEEGLATQARSHVEVIAERVRATGARRMGRHVTVMEPSARLADLVVPDALRRQLEEIVSWQWNRHRVRWSMELGDGHTGHGLACLLAGKSGTGKTFAARCLAAELGLNLYRVDVSQVVSKYIGETEKALARVFDEVEAGHGVLLFDEADALFGRRSEVKDAHDRYANIEVGYLLQRLESYDGMVVLTTNLQGNMDAAFLRRIRFVLHFPVPDRDMRRRLWDQSLPGPAWRDDDLELDAMADRFQLTGGAIHNIGLAAAHLAAATESGRITAAHLVRATQRELQKAGRATDLTALGALGQQAMANGGARP